MRRFFIYFSIIIFVSSFGRVSAQTTTDSTTIGTTTSYKPNHGLVSPEDLRKDYNSSTTITIPMIPERVNVLIVPGHEPNYGGAEYDGPYDTIYERNLTVELGQYLKQFLETTGNYQVSITRDTKSWNFLFSDYFKNNLTAINRWIATAKKNSPKVTTLSGITPIVHITAPTSVALRLFGITKWSNDNSIDLMIHIHFNDYPGHPSYAPGKYSGLVVYVPYRKFSNSSTTNAIADSVFKRLSLYNPTSNLKGETNGVIDDPALIAIGAANTSNAASMLIEYEYIYRPQLVNPKVRSLALKDMAYQTFLGLEDYFKQNTNISLRNQYNPEVLYAWNGLNTNKNSDPKDIYALQTALMLDGDFPPVGKTKNDCPHSGAFDSCTIDALAAFQARHGITDEKNIVGKKSFDILRKIY